MQSVAHMEIRYALESDLTMLAEMEQAAFPNPWSQKALSSELAQATNHFLLAIDSQSHPAGYIALRILDHEAEVLRIVVRPHLRRRGLGTLLLQHAVGLLERLRVRRCFLEVRDDNAAAQALYANFGARPAASRPGYYADGTDAIVLSIRLAAGRSDTGSY